MTVRGLALPQPLKRWCATFLGDAQHHRRPLTDAATFAHPAAGLRSDGARLIGADSLDKPSQRPVPEGDDLGAHAAIVHTTGRREALEPPAPELGPGAVATPASRTEDVDRSGSLSAEQYRRLERYVAEPHPLYVQPEPVRRMRDLETHQEQRSGRVIGGLLILAGILGWVFIGWVAYTLLTAASSPAAGASRPAADPSVRWLTAPVGVSGDTVQPLASKSRGWATYCAPTPTRCQSWGGDARLGAVPSFRWGDKPYQVTVRHGDRTTTVTVVSYCGCGDRHGTPTVIDLSPRAFRDLAPLSRGVIDVTLTTGGRPEPRITLPPTDSEETP